MEKKMMEVLQSTIDAWKDDKEFGDSFGEKFWRDTWVAQKLMFEKVTGKKVYVTNWKVKLLSTESNT